MGEEIERDHVNEMNNNQNMSNQNENQEEARALRSSEENSTRQQTAESVPTVSRAPSGRHIEMASIGFKIKILIIQNIGIVTGFAFMLLMAIHSESIAFD